MALVSQVSRLSKNITASQGKEANWEDRALGLQELGAVIREGDASTLTADSSALRALISTFEYTLKDLRSNIVREACCTLKIMSESGAPGAKNLVAKVLPTLSSVRGTGNTLNASYAHECIRTLIVSVPLRSSVAHVLDLLAGSKSKDVRASSAEYLFLALSEGDKEHLERGKEGLVERITEAMPKLLALQSPRSREWARAAFWAFHAKWPEEANSARELTDARFEKLLGDAAGATPEADKIDLSSKVVVGLKPGCRQGQASKKISPASTPTKIPAPRRKLRAPLSKLSNNSSSGSRESPAEPCGGTAAAPVEVAAAAADDSQSKMIDELRARISQLEDDAEAERRKSEPSADVQMISLAQMREKVACLEQQLASRDEGLAAKDDELVQQEQALLAQIARVQADTAQSGAQAAVEHEAAAAEHEAKLAAKDQELADIRKQISELIMPQVNALEGQIKEKSARLAESEAECQSLRGQQQCGAAENAVPAANEKLEHECAQLKQTAQQQNEVAKSEAAAKAALESKCTQLEQSVDLLKEQQTETETETAVAAEADIAAKAELESKCTQLEQTVDSLKEQQTASNSASVPDVAPDVLTECQRELTQAQELGEERQAQVDKLKAMIEKGKAMMAASRKLQKRQEAECEQRAEQLTSKSSELEGLRAEVATLQLTSNSSELDSLRAEVATLNSQIQKGKGFLVEANKKAKALEQQASAGGSPDQQKRISELEAQLAQLQHSELEEQRRIRELCSVPDYAQSLKMKQEISCATAGESMAVTPSKVRRNRVKTPVSNTLRVKAQLDIERNERKQRARAESLVQLLGEQQRQKSSAGDQFLDCIDPPFMPAAGTVNGGAQQDQSQGQGCAQQ